MTQPAPLRIGVLGAARIVPMALLRPAGEVREAEVVAVAARDPERAAAFARKHGIKRVLPSYRALLEDPAVDAIYNPLPNSLHAEWTIRALEAGKHVLCEKPLASNAREAEEMLRASEKAGRILGEAFHYRYHPLAARMREIVTSGSLGRIEHIEVELCFPILAPGNIRYRYDLAGGAMMDAGCYTVSMLRLLAGAEPRVTGARAWLASPQVDRRMQADFQLEGGGTGRIHCSLFSRYLLRMRIGVRGDAGSMRVFNPIAPHMYHRLRLRTPHGSTTERVPGDATYTHQLRAFVEAARSGKPMESDGRDGVANMRVIDAIYRAAGLELRGSTAAV